MSVTHIFRRLLIGVLLVVAIISGWFLRGLQISQSSTGLTRKPAATTNAPLNAQGSPLSSTESDPVFTDAMVLRANSSVRMILDQLTSGLRPGRGDSIPAAADVHVLPVVDVSFYNWRGELLSGWLSLTTPEAPVIILAHGTPGNRLSMLQRSAFLHNHGYNVLLFDFQSYGKSQGYLSTLGMVESEDILAAISFLHGLPDTMFSKIGVLGLSMGATAAVLAASRSADIAALVAESCPVDATRVLGDVPDDGARQADQELVEQVFGVDITQARPVDVVHKLAGHTAIFFINGAVDAVTPLPGMETLYQAAGDPKQYWVVPGAGHAESFTVDPSGYMQRVDAFFDAYLY